MVSLYDPKAIKAEINELLDEAKALTKLAVAENREPTEAEEARVSEIMDSVGEDGEDGPTGLRAKLATAERFQNMLAENRSVSDTPAVHSSVEPKRFKLPSSAYRQSAGLRAFRPLAGQSREDVVTDAYVAGQWLRAIAGNQEAKHWCADHEIGGVYNVMKEGSDTSAGYLVPDEMASRIILLREERGVFMPSAAREPMASDHKTVARRKGGVTGYWVAEAASVTASDLTFNRVELTAKAIAVLSRMSRELDADSMVSVADRVADEMAYAFADECDKAGFVGDGTSTYGGVVGIVNKANDGSHTGGLYTAATGNTAFSTLDLADFEGMAGQLPLYAEANAAWYISKVGYYQSIANLVDTAGGNNIADLGRGPERMFLGYPVRFVQVMNTVKTAQTSTAGLCILGDLTLSSLVGERQGMRFQVLQERYADTREIGLIGDTRVAINNHSVTDPGDSTAAGPVVVLKTPAS